MSNVNDKGAADGGETQDRAKRFVSQAGELQILVAAPTAELAAANSAKDHGERVRRIVDAFTLLKLSDYEKRLIQVALDNPGATTEHLSDAMGSSRGTWRMNFGKLCHKRESLLWPAVADDRPNEPYLGGILVVYDYATHGVTMRDEAIEGFAKLGMKAFNT